MKIKGDSLDGAFDRRFRLWKWGCQVLLIVLLVIRLFIVSSLGEAGQIGSYPQPLPPLLATALVALIIVVGMERLFVHDTDKTVPREYQV